MELCKQFGGDRTEKWFGFPTLINQVEESGDKNAEISTCLAVAMIMMLAHILNIAGNGECCPMSLFIEG